MTNLERCTISATLRNDGGDTQDPFQESVLFDAQATDGKRVFNGSCHNSDAYRVPELKHGESGSMTCEYEAIVPPRIDTSVEPGVKIVDTPQTPVP